MTRFVLDASVALAWCFEDETCRYSEAVLDEVAGGAVPVAPAIWPSEILNVVLGAVRRKRITRVEATEFLTTILSFGVVMDAADPEAVFHAVRLRAERHGLTAYHAVYLELAVRKALPLATLDQALLRAAKADGVEVFGEARHSG